MRRQEDFEWDDRPAPLVNIFIIIAAVVIAVTALVGVYFLVFGVGEKEAVKPDALVGEIVSSTEADASESIQGGSDDPTDDYQNHVESMENAEDTDNIDSTNNTDSTNSIDSANNEASVNILISNAVPEYEKLALGIDVSKYQGNIDWTKVAESGVEFAMIRVGYRTMDDGEIVEDSSAKYNLQEATANGIQAGVYFFSTAISEAEALEEAQWVADYIARYSVTYPVVYDCERYEKPESRQYNLTKEERTDFAKAFMNKIYELGYTPMLYASKGDLEGDSQWLTSELEKTYKIWVSWYPTHAYPETGEADYAGRHAMWQYSNNGTVPGIDYAVDLNVAYFGYENAAAPKDDTPPGNIEANMEAGHSFTEVEETVTAKDATNLRNKPSQGEDSTVMYTLKNGETATRTGISTSGWSRVVWNGEVYYAVSNYLTTDLTVKTPEPTPEPDDGIQTEFAPRDELVTPKEAVNLRTLPSVTHPDSKVVVKLPYGSKVKRTGINEDVGWSRVEYEGQTLYCVSSYVFVTE